MNTGTIAVLIRGLCIDITGKPQTVICQKSESLSLSENKTPAFAMKLEIDSINTAENAVKLVHNTYIDWKKNVEKHEKNTSDKLFVPSCAALLVNGSPAAFCWIDENIDSAHKRRDEKNSSARVEYIGRDSETISPDERADVVRNKIALVTGGAQGIGEEIVRNLAAAGALVIIADLNVEGARKLAEEINIKEKRTAALALEVNVCDESSVERLINSIAETAGGLDICISNAGVLKAGSVLEQELSDFKFVTDINYTGFFVICKYAGRLLRLQHLAAPLYKTDIIQINSKSGLEGSNKNGAYAGGKFGSLGLVASFAMELVEYNIKVNAICPGNFLDGPLWSHPEKGLFVQYLKTGKVKGAKTIADVRSFYESKVPMKRGCTGKDLMRALYYIIEQKYETGQAVPVTGGQVMLH